ncbi:hypothetical protein HNQ00_000947 [Flavobacterium sp. 14A]|nr:hypothetical protein [Flavobacterium sp. 14A]
MKIDCSKMAFFIANAERLKEAPAVANKIAIIQKSIAM